MKSNIRLFWDISIIIVTIIYAVLQINPILLDLYGINLIVYILFTIDIFLNFMTSYINQSNKVGVEELRLQMIAWNYLYRNSLITDILSLFPDSLWLLIF